MESSAARPFTVIDCNNFWSATGGGVRRYTLEKMRVLGHMDGVRYVHVRPAERDDTEVLAPGLTIEHVRAPAPPRTKGEYRIMYQPRRIGRLLERYQPDVVEIGSWYFLPQLVRAIARQFDTRPALVGFWHADFPRAYIGRTMARVHPRLGPPCESAGWWWARRGYGQLDAVFVASRWVAHNLMRHGIDRLYYTPLGVDLETFQTTRRDPALVEHYRAGDPNRPVILFAHRFQQEKGVRTLLAAYPSLCAMRTAAGLPEPALVFAGVGFDQARVEAAAQQYEHVHYIGYIDGRDAMSRWLASCDLFLALSPFETFGLSLAEAMACGAPVIAAEDGSAGELITGSQGGLTVPYGDADALARAMLEILSHDRDEFGRRGSAHIAGMTWERTFARELYFYRKIAALVRAGRQPDAGIHDMPDDISKDREVRR